MIAVVVVVGALVGFLFHVQQQAQTISKNLEVERYSRLVAEEKVVNTLSKIKQLENDLKASEEKVAKVQAVLKDQKNVNVDLEHQYEKLSKAKADLEDQLKSAVGQPPSAPSPMAAQETKQDMAVAQASN
jgi:septal ring factor EnvC (AmiA/AmiB activator)